jgi:transposase InsO family protein
MQAVLLVRKGWKIRKVARHMGFHHTAIMKWLKKAPDDGRRVIATESSRPRSHPKGLSGDLVAAIIAQRRRSGRCAEVVHKELELQGVRVSLSSVKRTLGRSGLIKKRSPWKRRHAPVARPEAKTAGDLVQVDTIHFVPLRGEKFYVYTLVDLHSRWAYAKVSDRINTHRSLGFLREAQRKAPFAFRTVQSDNGQEFSSWLTEHMRKKGMRHRHSRVRRSNDNAHVERFNRTLQDECLRNISEHPEAYQKAIRKYLPYYNNDRLHLGLNFLTPSQVVPSY